MKHGALWESWTGPQWDIDCGENVNLFGPRHLRPLATKYQPYFNIFKSEIQSFDSFCHNIRLGPKLNCCLKFVVFLGFLLKVVRGKVLNIEMMMTNGHRMGGGRHGAGGGYFSRHSRMKMNNHLRAREEDSLGGNDGVQVKNRSRQKHYFSQMTRR